MALDNMNRVPQLSQAEWRAVTVALRDVDNSPCTAPRNAEGQLGRLSRVLKGIEPLRPLDDPRVETLRRFVCASRRNVTRAREIGSELLAFGYSPSQIEALRIVAS